MKKIITLTLNPAVDKTLTVEGFCVGATNRVLSETVHLGGKGVNAARVARRFYEAVTAVGLCSENLLPDLEEELAAEGISVAFKAVPGQVRTNIKIFDRQTAITTELNGRGFHVLADSLADLQARLKALLPEASLLVLTGSLPVGAPPSLYADLIRMAHENGVKVILDADGEAFRFGVLEKPWAVKPNLDELARYAKKPLDSDRAIIGCMKQLTGAGVSLVVTSMGSRGAFFMNKEETVFAPSLPVTVKSTVGAGDSMVAALAYGSVLGMDLKDMARLAVAAGCVTASKEGTGLCEAAEVLHKSKEVRIEEYYES